jgi:hypothetical protein
MIESRRGAGFAQDALARVRTVKTIDAQELDRDLTAQACVATEVDFSHPAAAKTADKPILLDFRWKLGDRVRSIAPLAQPIVMPAGLPGSLPGLPQHPERSAMSLRKPHTDR